MKEKVIKNLGKFHDKYYKLLLLLPILIIIFSFFYLAFFYAANQDFMYRDISLTGGTSATIYGKINAEELEIALSGVLEDLNTREIYNIVTREPEAVIVETRSSAKDARQILETYFGYELTEENSSFEFTGSTLSESFYRQLLVAILIAFAFMAIVVFIIFRTFIPSVAVIISAFADILMTLVFVDLLGIKMSIAGIVAFLMLIGYSVDTDILLTTRILKRHQGSINAKLFNSFKTGITMTLTSIVAVSVALLVVRSFSVILTQIFTILVIGLGFDIFNTWITNASILKWYVQNKK